MQIFAYMVTYDGGGSGPCIMRCIEYLTAGAPESFGTAIEQIEIYPRCQSRDPIAPDSEFLSDRFQAGLATLPFVRFRRKSKLVEVSYASEWLFSKEHFSASETELPTNEFKCLVREFAEALLMVRQRITKSDDFDLNAFEAHIRRRLEDLDQHALNLK